MTHESSSPQRAPVRRSGGGKLRMLELYCGIGGCSAAVGDAAEIVAAVDIDRAALRAYRRNFPHPAVVRTLDSLSPSQIEAWGADLWWLSPPCQPYTRRGRGRDDADPRARSFLALIGRLYSAPPAYLAMENVPGFRGSRTHETLRAALDRGGYTVRELELCPTELGVPNRRRRFYLVAGRPGLGDLAPHRPARRRLADFLDPEPAAELRVDPALAERYRNALDVVDPEDPEAVAACFTSAYGHSPVRSGSYLRTADGLRRFSPAEVLRLLGFPPGFTLPPDLPLRTGWRLAGNSLSIPAVRRVLSAIPALAVGPANRHAISSGGAVAGRAARG